MLLCGLQCGTDALPDDTSQSEKGECSPVRTPVLPPAVPRRPLEEEPLLAARMVVEDGLCLLLDIQDIDRLWAARGTREDEAALRHRRTLLLEVSGLSVLPDLINCGKSSLRALVATV